MTVVCDGDVIRLGPDAAVEDAEPLAALLAEAPGRDVDWTGCTHLHTAVVQVLLAFQPRLIGQPADPFARRWIVPLLQRS